MNYNDFTMMLVFLCLSSPFGSVKMLQFSTMMAGSVSKFDVVGTWGG